MMSMRAERRVYCSYAARYEYARFGAFRLCDGAITNMKNHNITSDANKCYLLAAGLAARVAREGLVLVEEALVRQLLAAHVVPLLQRGTDQLAVDLRAVPVAAVVVAAVQEDAVLRLAPARKERPLRSGRGARRQEGSGGKERARTAAAT